MQVQKIQEGCAQIDTQFPSGVLEEGCYFMGNTGAGKSTTINYLHGQKMDYKFDEKQVMCLFSDDFYEIFPTEASVQGQPKIGHTSNSETMIPKLYTSASGLKSYDTPGFKTTFGEIQEILDSYANSKIFVIGNSVKIFLVIDNPTLKSSKGQFLVEAFQRLHNMFPNQFDLLVNSICIIVTKVQNKVGNKIIDKSDMATRIKNIMTQQKEANKEKAYLFDFVLKVVRQNQVFILKTPEHIPQTIEDLKISIKSIPSFVLTQNAQLVLSAERKISLINYAKQIQKLTPEIFQRFQIFFEKILSKGKSKSLSDFENFFKDLFDIYQKYSQEKKVNFSDEKVLQNFLISFKQVQIFEEKLYTRTLRIFRDIKFCKSFQPSIDCTKIMSFLIRNLILTIEKLRTIFQTKLREEEEQNRIQESRIHQQKIQEIEETSARDRQNFQTEIERMNESNQELKNRMIQYRAETQRYQQALAEISAKNSRKVKFWEKVLKVVAIAVSSFL